MSLSNQSKSFAKVPWLSHAAATTNLRYEYNMSQVTILVHTHKHRRESRIREATSLEQSL